MTFFFAFSNHENTTDASFSELYKLHLTAVHNYGEWMIFQFLESNMQIFYSLPTKFIPFFFRAMALFGSLLFVRKFGRSNPCAAKTSTRSNVQNTRKETLAKQLDIFKCSVL